MAAPDPTKFTSSAQIFSANHTLPQIRSIHKSLHVEIEDKASRLRTQVGGSYRELLGTADTIVQMRNDNDAVQELLGKIGWRCGRAAVLTKATGLAKFVAKETKPGVAEAARQKLLDGCLLVVSRLLKGRGGLDAGVETGDRLVLAAKVWVLSRLLVKGLGNESPGGEAGQAAESAKKALDRLRLRLRKSLDRALEKVSEDPGREDIIVKALCAHSLVNSSGAKDLLRHFLEVRLKAIISAFDVEEGERVKTTDDTVQSLKFYSRTLLDVQAVVSAKLSQALKDLTKRPLLDDSSLRQLEGLRLDIYEKWCSEEIQYFTPFIRHDDLDGKQTREMFASWAEKSGEMLLDGLKKALEHIPDFKSIMELRTGVLRLWIREGGKLKGIDPQDMQDSLRSAINARMLSVLETKVSKLRIVGSEVKATLESWQEGVTGTLPSLWDGDGYDEALSIGATSFIQEVASRFYGRSNAVSKAINCYTSWHQIIDDVKEVVGLLRKQRWDNDYDEIEDEETIETRQQLLSKDDPKMLQDRLDTSLDKSFKELENDIRMMWKDRSESDNSAVVAMYLLRILRDIHRQLPKREIIEAFGLDMVPSMHQKVARSVSASPVAAFVSNGLSERIVIGRVLWDGEPALPNQPSPEIFRLLHSLSLSLADAGVDLWTPTAMGVLKQHVSERLCEAWGKELDGLFKNEDREGKGGERGDESEERGDEGEERRDENDESEDEKEEKGDEKEEQDNKGEAKEEPDSLPAEQVRDLCTQWLFDISLLRCSIGSVSGEAAHGLAMLEDAVHKRSGLGRDHSRQRIDKAARGFWNRTSLLFGLLA